MFFIYARIKKQRDILLQNERKISISSIIAVPAVLLLITEAIQRGSILDTLFWFLKSPGYALATFAFLAAVYLLLFTAANRVFYSMLVLSVPLIVCSIISCNKQTLRELPLLPWNMLLMKELTTTISNAKELVGIFAVSTISGIMVFTCAVILLGALKTTWTLGARLIILAVSAVCAVLLYFPMASSDYKLSTVEIYGKQGLLSGMITYASKPWMPVPEGYSHKAAEDVLASVPAVSSASEAQDTLPDVIMVMGEAFWDPAVMENITYYTDPLPNLHLLQKETLHGSLLVNSYGGNTTNTEFEALTGLCTSFLAPDVTAYVEFYQGGQTSLPLLMRRLNYSCDAIHPYDPGFLSRNRVYGRMGFEQFVTEKDFGNAKRKGEYISDEETGDKILELYRKHKEADPDKPYFSFTVTMQNHYNYNLEWYGSERPVKFAPPSSMSREEANMLEGYLQGVHDTDRMLGKLIEYFSKETRPVVVIFFGDHLPSLNPGRTIYEKGGLTDPEPIGAIPSDENIRKLHTVPYIIWDNYKKKEPERKDICPAFLQAEAFHRYGLPMSDFQQFLFEAGRRSEDFGLSAWPQAGKRCNNEDEARYKILVYDFLFGKR